MDSVAVPSLRRVTLTPGLRGGRGWMSLTRLRPSERSFLASPGVRASSRRRQTASDCRLRRLTWL